jgi:hypothetical protein
MDWYPTTAEDKKKPQKDKSRAEGDGEDEMECEGDEAEMDFAIILRSNSEEVPGMSPLYPSLFQRLRSF